MEDLSHLIGPVSRKAESIPAASDEAIGEITATVTEGSNARQ